jgi:hypothetical protein
MKKMRRNCRSNGRKKERKVEDIRCSLFLPFISLQEHVKIGYLSLQFLQVLLNFNSKEKREQSIGWTWSVRRCKGRGKKVRESERKRVSMESG